MTAPTVSLGQRVTRWVLAVFVAAALGGLWLAISYKHTHPRPTHPGNNRPATVKPNRPAPTATK